MMCINSVNVQIDNIDPEECIDKAITEEGIDICLQIDLAAHEKEKALEELNENKNDLNQEDEEFAKEDKIFMGEDND